MSSALAASLRRCGLLTVHQPQSHLSLAVAAPRPFSMQYKDTEKATHPFDYVKKNYSNAPFLFSLSLAGGSFRLSSSPFARWSLHLGKHSRQHFVLSRGIEFRRPSVGLRSPSGRSDRFLSGSQARHRSNAFRQRDGRSEHPSVSQRLLSAERLPSQAGRMASQSQSQCHAASPSATSSNDDLSIAHGSFTHVLHRSFRLLSTRGTDLPAVLGQGIVTDRSYWSFYAILNVLRDFGFVSQDGKSRRRHRLPWQQRHSLRLLLLGYDFLLEYKVSIDYNLKMPRLIIFIDKDPRAVWEDLQRNGQVNSLQRCMAWSFFD